MNEEKNKIESKLREKYKGKINFKDNAHIFNLVCDIYKLTDINMDDLPIDVEKILSKFGISVNINEFCDYRMELGEYIASQYAVDCTVSISNPYPIFSRKIMAKNLAYHMLKILKYEDNYSCAGFNLPYSYCWIPGSEVYLIKNVEEDAVYFIEVFSSMLLIPVKTLSRYLDKNINKMIDPTIQHNFLHKLSQEFQSPIDVINQAMFLYKFIPEKVYADNDINLYDHKLNVEEEPIIEIKLPWKKS